MLEGTFDEDTYPGHVEDEDFGRFPVNKEGTNLESWTEVFYLHVRGRVNHPLVSSFLFNNKKVRKQDGEDEDSAQAQ